MPQFSQPIMITGATGYIGSWIVKELLHLGATIHATVRDLKRESHYAYLTELAENSPGKICFFEANLLDPNSFHEPMESCSHVFHVASPFKIDINDAQKELIDPALIGTTHVLEAAKKTASVKKVILTSSCAAICGDNIDLVNLPNQMVNENHWNTTSSLTNNPYSYSKTLAEKKAWEIADSQDNWQLIVINPSLVMGPAIQLNAHSESINLLRQMGDGTLRTGIADIGVGLVDVRDVATAHVNAALSEKAKGRHIICAENTSFTEMAQILAKSFGHLYPIPQRSIPKALIWLLGPLMVKGLTRDYISKNVGYPWQGDNRKSIESLGLQYRPIENTLYEAFMQLIEKEEFK